MFAENPIKFRQISIALVMSIAIIGNCKNSAPFDSASLRPDMLVKNFTSSQYQESKLSWELNANESSYFFDENRSIAKDITLNYYEEKKISAIIKADKAIIHLDSNDIDLIGNVDMLSTAGNKLYTTEITWNDREKALNTDEPVKIIKKNGDILKGIGLRANYDLENYEIKKNVVAITKNVKEKKE